MPDLATTLIGAIGPLVGVAVGSILTRGASRQTFIRELATTEIRARRDHYASFVKALWAYASRVVALRHIASELLKRVDAGEKPQVKYNFDLAKQRQDEC